MPTSGGLVGVTAHSAKGASATIVSSSSTTFSADPQLDKRAAERRTFKRRLDDAALRDAVKASPLYALVSCVVLLLGGMLSHLNVWSLSWIAVGASFHATWAWTAKKLRGSPPPIAVARRLRRLLVLSVALSMSSLAFATCLAPPDAMVQCLLILLASATALATASSLASMPLLAAPAAVVPLLIGLQGHQGSNLTQWPFAIGGVFVAALAGWVTVMRHRDWLNNNSLQIEQRDQLRAAETERDAAIGADHEKNRFLAIASHELRQPVHALGLFAGTLERRLQGSAEQPIMRNLIRAIEGLDRSFNTMLDISRLDSESIQPNIQYFSLRDLFRRLHMYFGGQAELAGLGLRFSPGGKFVSSDPQLLERIVSNLIQNALKYTEEGGVVVIARTTREYINIEVWDTGIGIEPRNLQRVFEEFYQASTGAKAQGLGMGLAIVKRLCRRLGHELMIASRPGKGTMFRVGIRIGTLATVEDAAAATDTLPMPLPSTCSVLIVEDEESIREGLRLLMEEWGYIAFGAASLSEAIDLLGWLETQPDVIVSDLHLGDGPNGILTINALRALCGKDIPAMLITGDTAYAEQHALREGNMQVLFKPVQPRKLHTALRELLNH